MNYADWIVIAYLTLSVFVYISKVGKPRDPLKPEDVAVEVLAVGIIMALLYASHS